MQLNQLGSMQRLPYYNRVLSCCLCYAFVAASPTVQLGLVSLLQLPSGCSSQKSLKTPVDTYRLFPFACMSSGLALKLRVSSGCVTCTLLIHLYVYNLITRRASSVVVAETSVYRLTCTQAVAKHYNHGNDCRKSQGCTNRKYGYDSII